LPFLDEATEAEEDAALARLFDDGGTTTAKQTLGKTKVKKKKKIIFSGQKKGLNRQERSVKIRFPSTTITGADDQLGR
jgi:hypothetical protein